MALVYMEACETSISILGICEARDWAVFFYLGRDQLLGSGPKICKKCADGAKTTA